MSASVDHRSEAEVALAHAQRNPIMSADQWFLSAQIHALLALDDRLGAIASGLRAPRDSSVPADNAITAAHPTGNGVGST